MKRRVISAIMMFVMLVVLLAPVTKLTGKAASCTFTFSDADVELGETFSMTLTWNTTDSDLGGFTAELSYDKAALELISGEENLAPLPQSDDGVQTVTFDYSFKALKAGTTSVSVVPGNAYSFSTMEMLNSTVKAGTVTVTEPTTAPPETEPPTTEPPTTEPPTTEPPTTEPPTTEPPTTEPPTTEPPTTEPPTTEPPTTVPPATAAPTPGETLSSNAYLEALSITPGTLSPEFDPEEPYYYATVGYDVTRVTVSCLTADVDAEYLVVNRDLAVGETGIDIKVTAADGSVFWYCIFVTREAQETTGEPTNGESTAAGNSTEESTEADPLTVELGNTVGYVQETLGDVVRPEGFEEMIYNFRGVEIEALKGIGKNLILVPISDGAKTGLYIYDEVEDSFYPYVGIQITSALYTILPFDENEQIPDGYKLTVVDFEGSLIDAWVRTDAADKNFVLFYAMNWNGETSLYRYDAGENTLQRINKEELSAPETSTESRPSEETTGSTEVNEDYVDYLEETLKKTNRRDTIMFIIVVLLLVCMIAMYMLFSAEKKAEESEEDDSDDDDPSNDDPDDDDPFDDDPDDGDSSEDDSSDDDSSDNNIDDSEEDDEDGYLAGLYAADAESDEYSDEDDAIESLQKELEAIQLGMAGIVADMTDEEEAEEPAESPSEDAVEGLAEEWAEEPAQEQMAETGWDGDLIFADKEDLPVEKTEDSAEKTAATEPGKSKKTQKTTGKSTAKRKKKKVAASRKSDDAQKTVARKAEEEIPNDDIVVDDWGIDDLDFEELAFSDSDFEDLDL